MSRATDPTRTSATTITAPDGRLRGTLEAQSDGTLLVEVEWTGPRQPPGELLRVRVRDADGDDLPSEYLLPLVTAANGRVVGTMNVPVSGERVTVELDPEPLAPDGLDEGDLGAVPRSVRAAGGLALRRWNALAAQRSRRTGCAGPSRQRGPARRPGPCPDSATKARPGDLPPPTPPVGTPAPPRHRHLPARPSAAAERVKSEEHEEPMAGTPGTPEAPRTVGRKPLSVLLDELTGAAQGWLSTCRTALAEPPGALDGLLAPDGDVAAALENDDGPRGTPNGPSAAPPPRRFSPWPAPRPPSPGTDRPPPICGSRRPGTGVRRTCCCPRRPTPIPRVPQGQQGAADDFAGLMERALRGTPGPSRERQRPRAARPGPPGRGQDGGPDGDVPAGRARRALPRPRADGLRLR
ncbi:hypothetical protein EQG64_27705 [Streptomyces sp. S6]|nr:hypothetical protein EQG64_27705 [Streptomyces sp. S6]